MPGAGNKMQFQKNYFTEENINKGGQGAFSSKFKSYITDGESALKDNIYQTGTQKTRADVMRDIRAGLRQRMQENNEASSEAAGRMMEEHKTLRLRMQEALQKVKDATRQKKLLEARLLAEKSLQSKDNAENSEKLLTRIVNDETAELAEDRMLLEKTQVENQAPRQKKEKGRLSVPLPQGQIRMPGAPPRIQRMNGAGRIQRQAIPKTAEDVSEKDIQQREIDLNYLQTLQDYSAQNVNIDHSGKIAGLFRAIDNKFERSRIEKDIAAQEEIIKNQQRALREKARAWNEKRKKDYESGSFRKYYDDYDKAISSYRALNRKGSDQTALPAKDIKEYVGEFDLEKLDLTLEKLIDNPYLNANVQIKNKKTGRGTTDEALLKSHNKITLLSEKDNRGMHIRYKLNENFEGYKAARQFKTNDPTALTERSRFVNKKLIRADKFAVRLKVDKLDAGQKLINSEDNLEIIQAKTKFLFTGKKVNGVYLNGEFLSADRSVIKGDKDSYTVGRLNTWKYTAQKEKVRKAVLKADAFRLINAKTIQVAAGYEANKTSRASDIQDDMKKAFAKRCGLSENEINKLFDQSFENNIFNKRTTKLTGKEADWEKTLLGNDENKKKELPGEVKIKVAYDVIRKEINADRKNLKNIAKKTTRIGKAFDVVSKDQKSVIELSLLLLSDDSHPEFWDMAKEICTNHMPHKFGLSVNEKKDNATMKRAVNYGRAEKGQMMRMALIDELNTHRKNFDLTNLFGAMMPTRYKQYVEDLETKRGFANMLKLKAVDGTFLKFVGDIFDSVYSVGHDMEYLDSLADRQMFIANIYMGAVTSCMNLGAITQGTAFGLSEIAGDEEYEDEKGNKHHTADDRKFSIGMFFTMVKNLSILIKAVNTWKDKRNNETKRKAENEPDYDPKLDYASTRGKYREIMFNLVSLAATMGTECAKFVGNSLAKNICSVVKNALSAYQSELETDAATQQVMRIDKAEKDFETLATKDKKTVDDDAMLELLEKNSQLQYGLSLAKKKSMDDAGTNALKTLKYRVKTVISALKTAKIDKLFPPLVIIDAAWTIATTILETGQEMYQHSTSVTQNVEKMLGKKFKDVNRTVLSKVLKREAGIVSSHYLPDLAKIFMAINTHQFMQKAETGAEKKLGSKIATTLLNNKNYTEDKLKKVKSKDLMKAMGVKGNFKKILTHALA